MFNTYTSMYPFPFIFQSANCDFLHEPLATSCIFQLWAFTMLEAGMMGCSGGWFLGQFRGILNDRSNFNSNDAPTVGGGVCSTHQTMGSAWLGSSHFLTPPAKNPLVLKKIIIFPPKIAIEKYDPPFSWADPSYHLHSFAAFPGQPVPQPIPPHLARWSASQSPPKRSSCRGRIPRPFVSMPHRIHVWYIC